MQRRDFLRGLFAFGIAAACGKPPGAEAAPLPAQSINLDPPAPRAETQDAILTDEDMAGARFEPVWRRPGHRPRGYAWGQRRSRRRYHQPRSYDRPRRRYWRRHRHGW